MKMLPGHNINKGHKQAKESVSEQVSDIHPSELSGEYIYLAMLDLLRAHSSEFDLRMNK